MFHDTNEQFILCVFRVPLRPLACIESRQGVVVCCRPNSMSVLHLRSGALCSSVPAIVNMFWLDLLPSNNAHK